MISLYKPRSVQSANRRQIGAWVAVAALLVASPAFAQFVATTQSGVPYPALSSPTPLTLTGVGGAPASDVGRAVVPIGFTFPWYDRQYTSLTVSANGFVYLEPASSASADFNANLTIPNSAAPDAVIAPFWDDLNGNNAGSVVQRQTVSGPNGQGLAIEWKDWNRALSSYSLTFQVRLWENGVVDFFYGPMTGMGQTITASIGVESPNGSQGTAPSLGCAVSNQCSLTNLGTVTFIRFGPPAGVDLQPNRLTIDSITENAGTLTISTRLLLRNFGTVASGPFAYKLLLSQDTVPDLTDPQLTMAPVSLSLNPLEVREVTATSTVTRPSSGSFYVMAVVDDANAVAETNESNNLVANSVPLSSGVDLVAESISGPALAGPGDQVVINVGFSNQGLEAAGSVGVKVWASTDALLTADDVLLATDAVTVSGGQSVQRPVTFVMPGSLRTNDYFFILQIDDGPAAGAIVESSETNNVVASVRRTTVQQADLVVDFIRVARPLPPYDTAPYAFFGEPIRVEALVRNQGGATAVDAGVAFFLSDNETLNGLSDPFMVDVRGVTLAPLGEQLVTATANVPARGVSNQTLAPGAYFFFAAAIAPGLVELNSQNNFAVTPPTVVKAPAPDLIPLQVRGPIRLAAGELFPLTRTFANQGNRPSAAANYRYYLSANPIITTDDVLLQIQTPTGFVDSKSVTLAVNQQDYATDIVQLPSDVPAATYYIGALIDPEGQIAEADKDNNGLAGQPVIVSAVALTLDTTVITDGVVGQPYSMALKVSGNVGPATFSLAQGSQLPPGLSLSSEGVLSGTTTSAGIFAFTLRIEADGRFIQSALSFRVLERSTSLSISTLQLPAPAKMLGYDVQLGARGGQQPYRWTESSGALTAGLQLSTTGHLTGSPTGVLGTSDTFTLRVTDVTGNSDSRQYTLAVVEAAPILIATPVLPNGVVGAEYVTSVSLQNASAEAVSRPVRWQVTHGALPPGLSLEPSQTDTIVLAGTPTRAGTYRFRIEGTDAQGRADSIEYTVLIEASALTLSGEIPTQVLRGDSLMVTLSAAPMTPDLRWFVRDGRLPPGIMLDSQTGVLSGTIASDAATAAYVCTLAVGTNEVELIGFRGVRIDVVETLETPKVKKKCSSSAQTPWLMGAAVVMLTLSRRRRVAQA